MPLSIKYFIHMHVSMNHSFLMFKERTIYIHSVEKAKIFVIFLLLVASRSIDIEFVFKDGFWTKSEPGSELCQKSRIQPKYPGYETLS